MEALTTGALLMLWGLWLILRSPRVSALYAASLQGRTAATDEPSPLCATLAGCCLIGGLMSGLGIWSVAKAFLP